MPSAASPPRTFATWPPNSAYVVQAHRPFFFVPNSSRGPKASMEDWNRSARVAYLGSKDMASSNVHPGKARASKGEGLDRVSERPNRDPGAPTRRARPGDSRVSRFRLARMPHVSRDLDFLAPTRDRTGDSRDSQPPDRENRSVRTREADASVLARRHPMRLARLARLRLATIDPSDSRRGRLRDRDSHRTDSRLATLRIAPRPRDNRDS